MAESAALALAASTISKLGYKQVIFFTDNEVLASYFKQAAQEDPPDWRIKPFTESFMKSLAGINFNVSKLDRSQNVMAHYLAHRSFRSPLGHPGKFSISCANGDHFSCPVMEALHDVSYQMYYPLTALCC
jgi:hypothetical protein